MLLTEKKKGVSQNGLTPNIIGICSYCVLDRPVFEWNQVLLHPELTPRGSFLFADGAHHKKPHSPTYPKTHTEACEDKNHIQHIEIVIKVIKYIVFIIAQCLKNKAI